MQISQNLLADSAFCDKIAESNKSCHTERSEISQNKRDFSPTAQNDKIMDCHDFATQNLAMTAQGNFAESLEEHYENIDFCGGGLDAFIWRVGDV
ncbi:hypothetical protein ACWIUD_01635 [Helicobacter sp. 23-1044]